MEVVRFGWITAVCVSGVAAASWMIQYQTLRTEAAKGVVISPPNCDDTDCVLAVQWRPVAWGFPFFKNPID